ncbi:MAG: hydrogenase [Deltaproteobacteria bacterium]|nr:hydrogenase [Deltaproteobacteria bacterium]
MLENLVIGSILLTAISGIPGLFFNKQNTIGERLANALIIFGSLLGISAAVLVFFPVSFDNSFNISWPWLTHCSAVWLHLDALTAIFLLPICLIAALGSIYARSYWPQQQHLRDGRRLQLFYGLLCAALILIVCARNTIVFLAAWEIMALTAFMALTSQDDKQVVREAGYVFLVAARLSTLCLFAMFTLLFVASGQLAFAAPIDSSNQAIANTIFLLGVAGFGLKAGIIPLHVWLPEAHARAPSHLSALFSGVLIKVGIYGLVRLGSLFAHPPIWWGALLLALGMISGVLGVAFAIGQHDLKRLLAYHSIENIGIICMGLGLAFIGRSLDSPVLLVLGIAGALLHVLNHSMFKALLFFAAGSVLHRTGTRNMDQLGGLTRRMPYTAIAFIIGAIAICGLPPLNGLVSEFLIYLGLFRTVASPATTLWAVGACGAPILALIGALALACFVKAFGTVFLGEARSKSALNAHEADKIMLWPMAILAIGCIFVGLFPPLMAPIFNVTATIFAPELKHSIPDLAALAPLSWLQLLAVILWVLLVGAFITLRLFTRTKQTIATSTNNPAIASLLTTVPTWDCGYAAPSARMQYTSSSLAKTIVGFFKWALWPKEHLPHVHGVFARPSSFHSDIPDTILIRFITPTLRRLARCSRHLRWIQSGSSQAYILGILIALIVFACIALIRH